MNEKLKHNDIKRSKICWDLCVMIAVFILSSVLMITHPIVCYRFGLTLSDTWFYFIIFYARFLVLLTLGLILILVVRLAIINFRFGIKRFLLQMTFIIVAISSLIVPRCIKYNQTSLQGFYENMKANADIDAIQDWLDSSDLDRREFDEYMSVHGNQFMLYSESWPDALKELPHFIRQYAYLMKSANNKMYVRVIYGGGPVIGECWSLVVGVGADEIPLDDYYETEERLELAPNAFVGYARSHD